MRRFFVIVIGSLLLCSVAYAQQSQTGDINGTVTLEDGSPCPASSSTPWATSCPNRGRP